MPLTLAFALMTAPVCACRYADTRRRWRGPFRAVFAGKGPEREFPWIVVGAQGVNVFGRLWPKGYAEAVAADLGRAA